MLKNILIGIFAAILVVAIGTAAYNVIGVNAAGSDPSTSVNQGGNGQGNGGNRAQATSQPGTGGNGNGTGTSVLDIPASDLSADERAALLFMYEEEKLARDVYTTLYATWNLPSFQNIAASEQAHMDEVALLLTRYGLTVPAQTPGVFSDASLQKLYTDLVAQGKQSAAEALKVGGMVEEVDIADLQTRLAQIDNADIQLVFNNLMSGSYNHLRAFAGAYTAQTGQPYTAQVLPAETVASILSGSNGNGNGGQGNSGQGSQGNGNSGGQNGAGNANGSGVPQMQSQANLAGASTFHGTVSAFDYGTLTIQTADGQVLGVQLGNQNYATSLGFAPQVGEGVTVYGFPGEQGLLSAITVTLDSTGQVYTFRDAATGRPAWAGGNGKGGGNR